MTTLTIAFPSQGWRQILTSKEEMLSSYDHAKTKAKAHEIEVYQGRVAESCFRDWLTSFLPKRYGVTAGYIVSPGLPSATPNPHFDVIVYDAMESPVLWVESDPSTSAAGRSLAIPAEYVCAVLEVKSSLTPTNVTAAIEHLEDLAPLMLGPDHPDERYKLHLPPRFVCGAVFFDFLAKHHDSYTCLSKFLTGQKLRGFLGGLVLRAEGHTLPHTGRVSTYVSMAPVAEPTPPTAVLSEYGMTSSTEAAAGIHLGTTIHWSEAGFAQFAFDLLAMMRGTYEAGRLSSFYGIGSSFSELVTPVSTTPVPVSPKSGA